MQDAAMNYIAPKSKGTATYQDILDAPEGMIAQVINGRLDLQSSPAPGHQNAADELVGYFRSHFRRSKFKPGGWLILSTVDVVFEEREIYCPDLSGWRTETLPSMPTQARMDVIPDWVCEVLSPSTRRVDRSEKMATYARHGVGHYWIVDPKERTLEVFELQGGNWVLAALASDDDVVSFAPFEEISIELADFWVTGGG